MQGCFSETDVYIQNKERCSLGRTHGQDYGYVVGNKKNRHRRKKSCPRVKPSLPVQECESLSVLVG